MMGAHYIYIYTYDSIYIYIYTDIDMILDVSKNAARMGIPAITNCQFFDWENDDQPMR